MRQTPSDNSSDDSVVRVRDVSKTYSNGTTALQNIYLDVAPHDFVSLVGPSGCGKSTLLRIIAGLGDATSGSVMVDGATPTSPEARRSLGYVFQDANLLPWQNVQDNVALPLSLGGVGKNKRREAAGEVLELVGLSDFKHAYPRELSGGMRMRVSIARALVTRPRLILMDEPFGALDEITRQRLNQELLSIKKQTGATVIFVTHNVFEAVYLSKRIAIMSAQPGRIIHTTQIDTDDERTPDFRGTDVFSRTVVEVTEVLERGVPRPDTAKQKEQVA